MVQNSRGLETGIKLSNEGLRILTLFLDEYDRDPAARLSGVDVIRRARLSSNVVYSALRRLEQYSVLEGVWEEQNLGNPGRPRRHLYRLTNDGTALIRVLLRLRH